jgi:hypothetical protein
MPVFVLQNRAAKPREARPRAEAIMGFTLRYFAFVLLGAAFLAPNSAFGFTFSDGVTTQCIAHGRVVPEFYAPPDSDVARLGRTGMTVTRGDDYLIIWNAKKLAELPPAIHDLLFFHECAHAQIPTPNEIKANCEGLKAMRAAKRADAAVEKQLAAFYGPGSSYWAATIECANAPAASGSVPH